MPDSPSQEPEEPREPLGPSDSAVDSAVDADEPIVELQPFEIEAFFSATDAESAPPAGDPEESPEESPEGSAELDPELPTIPGYHVEGVIGRGATGVVYRAKQTAVDRAVALKVLHAELITNERAVKRLKREARLAAKLAHPSIISAIDMGSVGGLWWYAMELVEGVPLSRRIAERRSLSERECLRLFSPLCDALQHAHEVGVVHRDIKPANILIDQRGRARLVDLGLAMSENDPSITKTGSTLGTPHYVSPEQARDPSQADIRSDLWSLGATLYHAICGHPPFHTDDAASNGVAEILSRVLYEPIIDPREFAPTLSKGFSLVLRKCLTRDPDQRYQEPWELVADIELLRERRRVDVSSSQLDSYASRRQAWVAPLLIAAGLLATVGGTWLLTARPWEEKSAPAVTERVAQLADWPILEAVRAGFDSGALNPADALAELDTPGMIDLPEDAQFLRNQLEVDVRRGLDDGLRGLLDTVDAEIGEALARRDFQGAAFIGGDGFPSRLRSATGFQSLDALPRGAGQRRAKERRVDQMERVELAHTEALRTAERGLVMRYGLLVNGKLEADLRAHRWRDAIQWLNPSEPEAWLARASAVSADRESGRPAGLEGAKLAEFNLSGLTADERRQLPRVIDGLIQSTESEVARRANLALTDVRAYMRFQFDKFSSEIEASTLRGEASAVDRFDSAVKAKHSTENLEVDQLPLDLAEAYGDELVKARDDLAFIEKRAKETLARRGVRMLEEQAAPLLRERDYVAARDLYVAARGEAWRSSTFDVLEMRARELGILQGVLERAAAGIEAARGQQRELTFEQIPRRGKIRAKRGEVLRHGFDFVPELGADGRNLIRLRDVVPDGGAGAARSLRRPVGRFLETDDLMAFAGLALTEGGGDAGLEPEEALAAAAFLCAEGKPGAARSLIRLEKYPSDDSLAADLERRSRHAATARRQAADFSAESSDERLRDSKPRPPLPGEARRRSVREIFGTPNQAVSPRDIRLVWLFAIGADTKGKRLRQPLPAVSERAAGWNLKQWTLTADGIELLSPLSEVRHFAQDISPSLSLTAPLNIDRRLRLEVNLVPGNDRPNGHIVAVSMRGYHALMTRGRVWFGGGNLNDLYVFVRGGGRGKHEGFEVRECPLIEEGKPVRITMELSPGALDRLEFNGESLGFSRFQDEPDRVDSFVRIRSLRPMVITDAEIRGDRVN